MRNAFAKTLMEVAEKQDNIWLLNADLGYSVLEPFAKKYPDRYLNVGIAEQNMAGIAAGLGMNECIPFLYSIGNFPTLRCFEQIRNDICYHNADVKIVSVGAGFSYGAQGYTHHAIEDLAAMKLLPKIAIFSPCDPVETAAMVRSMAKNKTPTYLRLGRAGEDTYHHSVFTDEELLKPHILEDGNEILIIATGGIIGEAIKARLKLEKENIHIAVASLPILKPLDREALQNLCKPYKIIITLEEHSILGGLYETLLPHLYNLPQKPDIHSLAVGDGNSIGIIGDQNYMRAHCKIDEFAIIEKVKNIK